MHAHFIRELVIKVLLNGLKKFEKIIQNIYKLNSSETIIKYISRLNYNYP